MNQLDPVIACLNRLEDDNRRMKQIGATALALLALALFAAMVWQQDPDTVAVQNVVRNQGLELTSAEGKVVAALRAEGGVNAGEPQQGPDTSYRSVITRPLDGPRGKVGQGDLTEFDALSDEMNRFLAAGHAPLFVDLVIDQKRYERGENRFVIAGPEVSAATRGERSQVADEGPYRAVVTRPLVPPTWRAGDTGYRDFPAVTDALNQLEAEGYQPFHIQLYTDPMTEEERRRFPPYKRLLILARRP